MINEKKSQLVCTLAAEEVMRVKDLGFLRDKTTPDCFNGRVITRNGKITAEEMQKIAAAAKKFGSGEVAMTSRLTVEIQRIPFEKILPLCTYLEENGLETGGTGPKVRPIVSCKGTTCQFGLIDTFALSEEIHRRFYKGYRDVKLPHKFKIAVGGCPNNCVKPDINDLGIIGARVPIVDYDKCRACKKCAIQAACPMGAVKLLGDKMEKNDSICNSCGRCIGKCPFGAFEEYTSGARIYIGGRWGKKTARGRALSKLFTNTEELLDTVERTIHFFRNEGTAGERFADTIERLGFEYAEKNILG